MIAVTEKDFEEYGCTSCGSSKCHQESYVPHEVRLYRCEDCGTEFVVMLEGTMRVWIKKSGIKETEQLYVEKHPLK